MEIPEKVRKYLSQQVAAADLGELSDSDSLLDQGLIDSIAMLGLIGFLEKEFQIKVTDDEVMPENFTSIDSIARLVQRKL